jgi:hypothetical protein
LCRWVPGTDDRNVGESVRPRSGQIQTKTPTTLPLEYFDSPDMEIIPLSARLEASAAAGVPLRAYSRFYSAQGAFTWAPCNVLEYDEAQEAYRIVWESTGRSKWVKRLNLFFEDEARPAFRYRLQQARRRQAQVEREARFHEYVKAQVTAVHSLCVWHGIGGWD